MYAKIFRQMYRGTLATVGPWEALVAFQQMIVLADSEGIVDMTVEALARETTIPIEIIAKGIAALEQPDSESRNPNAGGRRIVRLRDNSTWGWAIVNYEYYRRLKREEDRRAYHRQYWRDKRTKNSTKNSTRSTRSTSTQPTQPIAEAYAEAEAYTKARGKTSESVPSEPLLSKSSNGSRLPQPFEITDSMREWGEKHAPGVDLESATAEFVDYWRGVPGARGRKLDWEATWRNRMREKRQKQAPRKTRFEELMEHRHGAK